MGYPAEIEVVGIVFEGPPDPGAGAVGAQFVEIEDAQGRSLRFDDRYGWSERGDGEWVLRLPVDAGSIVDRTGAAAAAVDTERLEYWRRVMAGQAGFNGHPQAIVRLMEVSDAANLRVLARAYPEAVAALLETRR